MKTLRLIRVVVGLYETWPREVRALVVFRREMSAGMLTGETGKNKHDFVCSKMMKITVKILRFQPSDQSAR